MTRHFAGAPARVVAHVLAHGLAHGLSRVLAQGLARVLAPLVAPLVALLLGLAATPPAHAAFPARYAPTAVLPAGTPERHEFDLNPALARAAREGKRVYLYLGASDCPFCRRYEAFLERHADELVAPFARDYIVYDLRSNLSVKADKLYLRIGDKSLPYAEAMRAMGDERARQLVYPSVWLLDGKGRPLMQMPAGTGTFETVPEQLEILRLEQ